MANLSMTETEWQVLSELVKDRRRSLWILARYDKDKDHQCRLMREAMALAHVAAKLRKAKAKANRVTGGSRSGFAGKMDHKGSVKVGVTGRIPAGSTIGGGE